MDAEISQSEQWLRFQAWLEDNWRRVLAIALVVIGVGIVIAFVMWQGQQKQRGASEALSVLLAAPEDLTGEALLAFSSEKAGTDAGARALLLGAGALFTEGKFPEAQEQFQRFLAEDPAGPMTAKARFGVAACKDAQGLSDSAISDYESIVKNPASGNVIPQARFALGSLYVAQGQPDLARAQYEELLKIQGSSLAAEARARLAALPASTASRPVDIPALAPATVTDTNQP